MSNHKPYTTPDDNIQDTTPENPKDHPNITYCTPPPIATLDSPHTPPADPPTTVMASSDGNGAPEFNPNPLANITWTTPATAIPESASAPDKDSPTLQGGSTGRSSETERALNSPTPNAQSPQPTWTTANTGMQAASCASSSNAPLPAPSNSHSESDVRSNSSTTKATTKTKKPTIMHPGKLKTARNLFAISYLKDHSVMHKEFAKVRVNLNKATQDVYKQWEKDVKEKATDSMSD
ncbi:hypothetical protein EI94DRAFT_1798204 [Lactarius quietus]|nr:hypothetical protein EI94DRAFT_1798204 [Lactarius quietus]